MCLSRSAISLVSGTFWKQWGTMWGTILSPYAFIMLKVSGVPQPSPQGFSAPRDVCGPRELSLVQRGFSAESLSPAAATYMVHGHSVSYGPDSLPFFSGSPSFPPRASFQCWRTNCRAEFIRKESTISNLSVGRKQAYLLHLTIRKAWWGVRLMLPSEAGFEAAGFPCSPFLLFLTEWAHVAAREFPVGDMSGLYAYLG